jgi:nucleoid DNA-binding protein
LALTQTQLAMAVAERAEITRAEAKRILGTLEEIVLEEIGNAQKVRVGGLVQLTVRVKPAQKKRKGQTGPPARRSRSPPSPRASTFARGRLPRPRPRCHRCRKRADDSPPEALLSGADRRSDRPSKGGLQTWSGKGHFPRIRRRRPSTMGRSTPSGATIATAGTLCARGLHRLALAARWPLDFERPIGARCGRRWCWRVGGLRWRPGRSGLRGAGLVPVVRCWATCG